MPNTRTIFVFLVGEAVDVWRPVQAEWLHDAVYRILPQPYDPTAEAWAFEPGDEVFCEIIQSHDGPILAATHAALG